MRGVCFRGHHAKFLENMQGWKSPNSSSKVEEEIVAEQRRYSFNDKLCHVFSFFASTPKPQHPSLPLLFASLHVNCEETCKPRFKKLVRMGWKRNKTCLPRLLLGSSFASSLLAFCPAISFTHTGCVRVSVSLPVFAKTELH